MENSPLNLSEPVQGTTGHHGAKAKGYQRHCMVLHNMLRTHESGADRASITANDVVALQNEQEVYGTNDTYKNPSREAKHK